MWYAYDWQMCSTTCGGGTQKRETTCISRLDGVTCDISEIPFDVMPCNMEACRKILIF